MTSKYEKLRAIFLSALMVVSVFGATVAFTGSVAAAANAGPETFADQGTDAGTLKAGDVAVVQTIDVADADSADDGNDVTINSLDVDLSSSGAITSEDVSEIRILDGSDTVLGTESSVQDLSTPISVTGLGLSVPDDGATQTLKVEVTIASSATGDGTLSVSSTADYSEGAATGTTGAATDGASESVETNLAPKSFTAKTGDSSSGGSSASDTIYVSVDDGSGIDTNDLENTDFVLSTGQTVSGVSLNQNGDIVLTLGSDLSADATPDVSLVGGRSLTDNNGNAFAPGSDTVLDTASDGLKPTINDVSTSVAGNTVTVSVSASEPLDTGNLAASVTGPDPSASTLNSFSESSGTYTDSFTANQNGAYSVTLTTAEDQAATPNSADLTGADDTISVGNVNAASISASPNGGGLSATHTAAMSVGSETTVSTFEIDYGQDEVSGLDSSDIQAFGIDANGNGQLDSGETTLTPSNVNDTDGTALVVEADSAQTLSAGEGLVVEYSTTNPSSTINGVNLDLDPDQGDATATRTLTIDSSAATVDSISTTPSGPLNEQNTGDVDVTVNFGSAVDTNTAPTVEVRGISGAPIPVTGGMFTDSTTWTGTFSLSDNNEDVTGTINVSGVVDDAGNSVSSEEDLTVDTLPLGISSATTVEESDSDDVGSITVVLNDTVGTLNKDSFSVEDDGSAYGDTITLTDSNSNDNVVTVELNSQVAADGGLNVTLTGGSTTDDASNGVGGSETVTATDGIAPDIESISATNPQSNDVNVNVSADEELATLTVDESGDTLSKSDFEAVEQNNGAYWYNVSLTNAGQGQVVYDVTSAADAAGNDDQSVGAPTDSVTLDTEAPTITANDPSDGAVVTDSNEDLTVDITDTDGVNTSSIRVSLSDANGEQLDRARVGTTAGLSFGSNTLTIDPSSGNFGNFADGTLTLDVEAADVNGVATSQTFTYEVDTQTDATSNLVQAGTTVNVTSSDTIDVQYEYNETAPSEVLVKLDSTTDVNDQTITVDDSQYAADGSTKTITLNLSDIGPAEDTYDVTVQVKDSDTDNTYNAVTAGTIVVDGTAPDVTSVDVVDNNDGKTNFTANVVDDETDATGVANVVFNVSGEGVETEYDLDSSVVSYDGAKYVFDTDAAGLSLDGTYTVNVTAVDYVDNEGENLGTDFDVNPDQPTLDSIEAEAGSDEITLEFSEVVGSTDAELSADDFAYTDNSDGNEYITGVSSDGSNVTLTLSESVDTNDLETDTVNVIEGAVNDTEPGDNLRSVPVQTVALTDTDNPVAPTISAGNVTAQNEGNYEVTVDTTGTASTATVTILNSSGSVVAQQTGIDISTGTATKTFGLSNVEQGAVTIEANVTDRGVDLTSETVNTTVQKDNVSATIESVETNAGTSFLDVQFSEDVDGANIINHYTFENLSVDNAYPVTTGDKQNYTISLTAAVQPSDINNSSVTVAATTSITDVVGTQADTSAVMLEDGDAPAITGADASNGTDTVEVDFSEQVFDDNDNGLSADNFTYVNNSGVAHSVVNVSHNAGDQTATVTLNSSLVGDDLNSDKLEVVVNDSVDKQSVTSATIVDSVDISSFTTTNTTSTAAEEIQVSFQTDEELESLEVDIKSTNDLREFDADNQVASGNGIELNETHFDVTDQGDGTYVYTYNYTVPRDGEFSAHIDLVKTVGDKEEVYGLYDYRDTAAVDYSDPTPVDAELDDTKGDHVDVQFDEPVVGDGLTNITADGQTQNNLAVNGHDGEVTLVFQNVVATGDGQNIAFGVDSIAEKYGDGTSANGTSETVDTHEYHLSEGVNFVSVPAEFGKLDIAGSGFSDMTVMTYENGEWLTYAPDRASSNQDIESMEGGQGYIVKTDADATVDVTVRNEQSGTTAENATPGQQQLQEGWNLVGHWQEDTQSADDAGALDSIGGDSTATHVYGQQTAGEFSYTTATDFDPGNSYWVFVENDEVYTAADYDN